MAEPTKKLTPAYTTYPSFYNLISDLRENGIPEHISRSVIKGSNSAKATMAASLKSLSLVNNNMEPMPSLSQLVENEEDYSNNLRNILEKSYDFLFDNSINIENTTTEKVVEKFKEAGAGGSTISKGISFFLAAAKAAGIEVSSRVKAPAPERKPSSIKKTKAKGHEEQKTPPETVRRQERNIHPDMQKITVPLRDMEDGIIYFPKELEEDDDEAKRAVEMAVFILKQFYRITN